MDFTSSTLALYSTLFIGTVAIFWALFLRRSRYHRLVAKIPGPPGLPLLGNALQLAGHREDVLKLLMKWYKTYGIHKVYKFSTGRKVFVVLSKASCAEPVLSSSQHIEKSIDYNAFLPWLGTGLLTSTGAKWKSRRKLLTPAFHFRILEDMVNVFNEHSKVFLKQLSKKGENEVFDIFPYVTLCTLDAICETAMGRHLNSQIDKESEYVKALYKITEIVFTRILIPWYHKDWMFRLFPLAKEHDRCIKILHDFTEKVIQERKIERRQLGLKSNAASSVNEEDVLLGRRKRLAFLDLLLETSQDGKVLSDEDIREEVDTFMFEGHDTTAAAISATIYLLGCHPDHQLKVQQEIDDVLGDDDERSVTLEDITKMKYLECVLKESLRLFPSVPLVARKLTKDITIENTILPAGVVAFISPYILHRDPEVFPDSEKFDPSRFAIDNLANRNPYAYIPFSAGPRNCIGQKFAMMELKIVLVHFLRRFTVKSTQTVDELKLVTNLILRPATGTMVKLFPRK